MIEKQAAYRRSVICPDSDLHFDLSTTKKLHEINMIQHVALNHQSTDKSLQPLEINSYRDLSLVTRRGFEPRTHCLKGSCSAD